MADTTTDTTTQDSSNGSVLDTFLNNAGDTLSGVADVIAAMNGKPTGSSTTGGVSVTTGKQPATPAKSNTTWIVIGVAAVALIIVYILFGKK